MKDFDVIDIKLKGKNLVEASAGTGKTYAIGILVLRLILENKIKIEQILMVTYTNAAVDELEIRIRKFINDAILHVRKISLCDEELIRNVLDKSIADNGEEITLKLLNEAVEFMDETSIFTIHGFCKRVLTDYAFENSMLLNTEIIDDQSKLIEDAVTEFWRREINVIEPSALQKMLDQDFSIKNISELYKKVANGAELKIKNEINLADIISDVEKINQKIKLQKDHLKNVIENNWPIICGLKLGQLKNINSAIQNNSIDEFEENFFLSYKNNPDGPIIQKLDFLFPAAQDVLNAENEFSAFLDDVISCYCRDAVEFINNSIELKKKRNKLVSFYDLIKILHNTLITSGNQILKKELNYKYKAVFIDEFQDTDELQYDIFRRVFIEDSEAILFFIGDPKQSIYSFRGADLDTYNLAKENLNDSLYSMNTNFRSTKALLDGINEFYGNDQSSETERQSNLNYKKVDFGNDKLGELLHVGNPDDAFEIFNSDSESPGNANQEIILEQLVAKLAELFKYGKISKNNRNPEIVPSDIGILVRNNEHGKKIKDKLSKHKIPAVVVDDTRVLETTEAKDLYYVLLAILNPDNSYVSRALLTSFTSFTPDQIGQLNLETQRELFLKCQDTWKYYGVYAAVSEFISNFNVRSNLIFNDNPRGKRIYSNLIQLAEILNEKEIYEGLSAEQVVDWLLRARQGDKTVAKYEQQLEDDENSVQIVTVHKSKGLAYNIVILPFFNLAPFTKNHFCTVYKDMNGKKIVSVYNDAEEDEYRRMQEVQENDRLLYVAITRAVYKCVIFHGYKDNGILTEYINKLPSEPKSIVFKTPGTYDKSFRYFQNQKKEIDYSPEVFNSEIDSTWKVTSYSALSPSQNHEFKTAEIQVKLDNEYDDFVFNSLRKGVQTGLLMHKVFEKINFSNPSRYKTTVEKILNDFGNKADDILLNKYLELISNVLNTKLSPVKFKLSELNYETKLNELEFYFSIDRFKTSQLKKILPHIDLTYSEIEGVMNGFIDLVFEHDERFYILDWKTNHLGYETSDYSKDILIQEIRRNHYDLQYLIYTIALIRYLKSKKFDFDYDLDFGGVIYLFIRGMREGEDRGIFFDKPDKSVIEELEKVI